MAPSEVNQFMPGGHAPTIVMPLPDEGFDVTEAAVPWQACTGRGWRVLISTEHGRVARADPHKLTGPLPGWLSASPTARAAYEAMVQDTDFQHPIPYAHLDAGLAEALLLPGGDAPGMRQYLDSRELQSQVLQFWQAGKVIGAICHGILVLTRTINPETGRSVLFGHKVTALPKSLDRTADLIDSWLLKRGYIMYGSGVEDEVRACLERPEDLSTGPNVVTPYAVTDGNLVTARWYHDAEIFAQRFGDALHQRLRLARLGAW